MSASASSKDPAGGTDVKCGYLHSTNTPVHDDERDSDDDLEEPPLEWLEPHMLKIDALVKSIIDDRARHYYVSQNWDPRFYIELAYIGFVAVTHKHLLLPEIQRKYCVLDWPHLHLFTRASKQLRKECKDDKSGGLSIRFNTDIEAVFRGIETQWKDNNWLTKRYQELLKTVLGKRMPVHGTTFYAQSVEIWLQEGSTDDASEHGAEERLVAGEIGYSIGKVYTSLTGFADPGGKCYGTVQLMSLGLVLKELGYAFWNLGHPWRVNPPCMMYKKDIGGHILTRHAFKERWDAAVAPHPKGTVCPVLSGTYTGKQLLDMAARHKQEQVARREEEAAT